MTSGCGMAPSFAHTLFLGTSITSFNANLGWNSNSSELSVQLVHDPCPSGNKVYYNGCGEPSGYWQPDFFNPPKLGSPVYFQYNQFSFAGMLQNWQERHTSSAKLITCRVTDPRDVLDGTIVILGTYNGNVDGVPNLLNVYGFLEEWSGTACPTDPSLLSLLSYYPALGYGGSYKNEAGISWNRVRNALGLIINATPPLLQGKYGGQLRFRDHFYYLDLSEIPYSLDDYRISGESTTLLNIINEVCQYGNLDWYCDLMLLASGSASYDCDTGAAGHISTKMAKFIKIRTKQRFAEAIPPKNIDVNVGLPMDTRLKLGKINSVIAATGVIDSSRGIELRNGISNAVIIGDKRQDLWQVHYNGIGNGHTDTIWPYWGTDRDGNAIIGSGYNDLHNFNVDISGVLPDAALVVVGRTYNITAQELSCAAVGKDVWENYMHKKKTQLFNYLSMTTEADLYTIQGWKLVRGRGKSFSLHDTRQYNFRKGASESLNPNALLIERLKGLVLHFAHNYYGKQFMVSLPVTCYHYDPDKPYVANMNWDVSDGAWSEFPVLGLANSSVALEIFRLNDGRIGTIGHFNNIDIQLDLSDYPIEDYLQLNDHVAHVKGNTKDIIFLNPSINSGVRAIVEFANPVYANAVIFNDSIITNKNVMALGRAILLAPSSSALLPFIDSISKNIGQDTTQWGMQLYPVIPSALAIPLRSKTLTYGPWKAVVNSLGNVVPSNFGSGVGGYSFGVAGKTMSEVNSSLNPWEFGSISKMNVAGQLMANGKISRQEVVEVGNMTVAGAPTYELGRSILVNGPEVTNIDVSVNENGIATTYEMRTYTPDFNTISQVRVDNLRQQNNVWRQIQRLNNLARLAEIRGTTVFGGKEGSFSSFSKSARGIIFDESDRHTRTSSHHFIFGQSCFDYAPTGLLQYHEVLDSGDLEITNRVLNPIVFTDFRKMLVESEADDDVGWQKKSGMEMNGLLRSYTTNSGVESLMPQMIGTNREALSGQNQFTQTPTCPSSEYNYANHYVYMDRGPCFAEGRPPIVAATMNPFLQPSGDDSSGPITTLHQPSHMMRFTLGSGVGHDIEYVVRNSSFPLDLSVYYPSGNYSSQNWYRALGVKTPLVLVGWGYDIYGRPVPNKHVSEPGANSGNPTAYFEDDWLQKPQNWKAGPLDVRWDESRGVWTSPPSYRVVRVVFCESALGSYDRINAKLHSSELPPAYNQDGSGIFNMYINVRNPLGFTVASGTSAWAFYNPSYSGGLSENYADYQLLYYNANPVFTIRTTGQGVGSGEIISANPNASDMDQWNAYITGGPNVSGYYYQCTFSLYDESLNVRRFTPQTYPLLVRGATIFNANPPQVDLGSGVVPRYIPVINSLAIPVGAKVNVQWNNSDSWVVINSEAFNTPVTNIVP